ncbi:MAG: antitermination protein NusG [Ruminococcus sp.]|nr:antitermination protein NusG [Ruminococcus sp.]
MKMYVLQVKYNKENQVKNRLEKMGFSAFNPTEEIIIRSNGKWKSQIKLIFPQYVFVECEMTSENYRRIKSVPKVLRFLGDENPEPLPADEREYIMILNNNGEIVRASEIEVSGDGTKKVVSGMLKKYEDKIIFINPRQRRAGIKLELCGKKHFLTLPVVEKNSV